MHDMKYKTHKLNRIHFKINSKTFWVLSIFLTISLVGVLVFQTQLLAQKSEFVSQSQKKLAEFSREDNTQTAILFSEEMSELTRLAQNFNFEKIDKIYYINAIQSTALAE